MMKKWIQIWYSWGDQETAVEVPDGTDTWEYMKQLAINEAAASFHGHEDAGEIGLKLYKDQKKICLHYPYDNEYCYYLATDTQDYDPNKESAVLSGAEISVFKNLFSKFCISERDAGHCTGGECEWCPVQKGYEEIFDTLDKTEYTSECEEENE